MRKKNTLGFILFLFLIALFVPQVQGSKVGLGLSPTIQDVTIDSGESKEVTFVVWNSGDVDGEYKFRVSDNARFNSITLPDGTTTTNREMEFTLEGTTSRKNPEEVKIDFKRPEGDKQVKVWLKLEGSSDGMVQIGRSIVGKVIFEHSDSIDTSEDTTEDTTGDTTEESGDQDGQVSDTPEQIYDEPVDESQTEGDNKTTRDQTIQDENSNGQTETQEDDSKNVVEVKSNETGVEVNGEKYSGQVSDKSGNVLNKPVKVESENKFIFPAFIILSVSIGGILLHHLGLGDKIIDRVEQWKQ